MYTNGMVLYKQPEHKDKATHFW